MTIDQAWAAIQQAQNEGAGTLQEIADALNAKGLCTLMGVPRGWGITSVRGVCKRMEAMGAAPRVDKRFKVKAERTYPVYQDEWLTRLNRLVAGRVAG